jgi:catechol 2,3-dioxygenase-like lactoylglutathione lyase family enzyme
MPVTLNHTIVVARNNSATALFYSEILGFAPHQTMGHFAVVHVDDMSLDFVSTDEAIAQQHFAFLVSKLESNAIFGRLKNRVLTYWADPFRKEAGQINRWDEGRGLYFDDPNGHLLENITRPYGGGADAKYPNPLLPKQ